MSIGRDGDALLIAVTDDDGVVLTGRLRGYFLGKLAQEIAAMEEQPVAAMWANRARISHMLRPICAAVAAEFGMPYHHMLGPDTRRLAHPRFAAAWVATQLCKPSMPQLARHIGYATHDSIYYALKRAEELRGSDADFRAKTDRLVATFNPEGLQ